jgi:uncharacterized membrane protein
MAKASRKSGGRGPRQPGTGAAAAAAPPGPNWPVLALAVIGLVLAGYLTGTTWSGEEAAFCEAGADCDIVLHSRWSTLLGLPTSLWGFFIYAVLACAALVKRRSRRWKLTAAVSLFGVAYSVYLTAISVFRLEAACPYCLTSLGLLAAILVVTLFQIPQVSRRVPWKPWLGASFTAAAVAVLALHLVFYSGATVSASGKEDPWLRGLTAHLEETGAKMYGAFWCPACANQKEQFGASAHRIPYVECSPGGRNAPTSSKCLAAGIRSYPTWIITGQRHTGVLSPGTLAERSGFAGIKTPAKEGG